MNCRKYKIIPFLLVVVLLSGCTTKYEQKDIYDYIEENYALEDVKVSKERTELTGEDVYTDYLWEITADDIKFRVLDDYHWGMETLTNHLTDDYEDVMLKKYYDSKILPHFTLDEKEEQGLYSSQLVGKFHTKEELIQLYEELENFQNYVTQKGYTIPNSFSYHLQMQSPIRNHMPAYVVDDGDSFGRVTDITQGSLKEAITNYIQTYTDYHFNDLDEKFTREEIIQVVSEHKYQIAIIKEDNTTFYDDLCASQFGYGISFGTLYEILEREGFNVSGNNEHYSFADFNGNIYEISYDFINVDGKNDESNHYYYLKNGEPVKMAADFYNHFSANKIEEMCGLKLYIGQKNLG